MFAVATDELQVQLLRPDAQAPARTRAGDAGFDLRCVEAFSLAPGERAMVGTGVAIALPDGLCGLVVPRSGLAARHGIANLLASADNDWNVHMVAGIALISRF